MFVSIGGWDNINHCECLNTACLLIAASLFTLECWWFAAFFFFFLPLVYQMESELKIV